MIGVVVISFLGFKKLISMMYPILGYIGILMLLVLLISWFREKGKISSEKLLRHRMIKLISKKFADDKDYTKKDKSEFHDLGEKSIIDTSEIKKVYMTL